MSNKYKTGEDRNQISFFSLDDIVDKNDTVRIIDKVVDEMNVAKFNFKYSERKNKGQHSYNPSDMLKLYIYCCMNKVRSSRKIEKQCHENIKVMWLMRNLKPDHKTISDFRKNNHEGIKEAFCNFVLVCESLNLIGSELIVVDGTKMRASNSKDKYYTLKKVEEKIEYHQKRVSEYMETLEHNDKEESKNLKLNQEDIENKIDKIKSRIEELEELKTLVAEKGSIATTDADCKLMKMNNGGFNLAYNVQLAVDEKCYLAVAVDVVNAGNDNEQLYNISKQAKENLEVDEITVLADGGYNSGAQFAKCEEENIIPIVSVPRNKKSAPDERYSKDKFKYDKENDTYTCPQNFVLSMVSKNDTVVKRYSNPNACKNCVVKSSCTKSKYRDIERMKFEDYSDVVDARAKENKQLLKKRKETIEHLFGTLKRNWGFDNFLTRGIKKVNTEIYIYFLASLK